MSSRKRILDCVSSPADLHVLSEEQLALLADEIREEIIGTTSKTGGHVASSLGAVEIILAVHSILDSPKDKVLFDVGHQSYAHKLITGRLGDFPTLRQFDGISGFPRPSESVHDAHPSGHASDSLSVASGLAMAKRINGTDERIVAIIGDAAIAGGMAFEALNFIGSQGLPVVVILNDNEMSISRNVGALMNHFGNIRANNQYRDVRENLQDKLEMGGKTTRAFAELGKRAKDSMKHLFIPESMLYEQLGIVCTAPIDGHDIHRIREILKLVLEMDGPALIHVVTKKGAGYPFAEAEAERFHGIGPYDVETGRSVSEGSNPTYTKVFGESLVREAQADPNIVAITAAMEGGTGLKAFHDRFPDRFIDVGIAEEQAVGMASGLAAAGKKPVVAIYSTFMQRAIDQAIVDVALPNLDVVFALDRAGLVGEDGPTHHGVFDIAYMRMIPNMKVIAPSSADALASALHTALRLPGPVSIRYPRGEVPANGCDHVEEPSMLEVGRSHLAKPGNEVAILAFGRMVQAALEVAEILEGKGHSTRVVDMIWAKPLDADAILDAADCRLMATIEDGIVSGGAGEGVLDVLSNEGISANAAVFGFDDEFVMQGSTSLLMERAGLDAQSIAGSLLERLA